MHEVMDKLAMEHMYPSSFGTGVKLHRAEIHTVQAIGENEGINLTKLSGLMGVTKETVSQKISKLSKKGLVDKKNPDDNAKEIKLRLTEKGWAGFKNHDQMHMQMYDIVNNFYGKDFDKKIKDFSSMMEDLNSIMDIIRKEKSKN